MKSDKSYIYPGNIVLIPAAVLLREHSFSKKTNDGKTKGPSTKKYYKAVVLGVYSNWARCQYRREGFTLSEGFFFYQIKELKENDNETF